VKTVNNEEPKFFVSITTTKGSNWRERLKEAKELGIKEVAFFLTTLDLPKRMEAYKAFFKAGIIAPVVHLRHDACLEEISFLIEKLRTEIFNVHPEGERPLSYKEGISKYKKKIYLENSSCLPTEKELKEWAGLCIDFAHWEDTRKRGLSKFAEMKYLLSRYPAGFGHISIIKEATHPDEGGLPENRYDSHTLERLRDLDYLRGYPLFWCRYMAMELINNLKDQLEAIKYIQSF
jgi:hypothetical protein